MRALALGGQPREALRQYEICREQLAREMGVEPSPGTTRLYQQICVGVLSGRIVGEARAALNEVEAHYRQAIQVARCSIP